MKRTPKKITLRVKMERAKGKSGLAREFNKGHPCTPEGESLFCRECGAYCGEKE